jgi:hypothetical protein
MGVVLDAVPSWSDAVAHGLVTSGALQRREAGGRVQEVGIARSIWP